MSDTTAPTSFEALPLEVLGDIFSHFNKCERQKLRILNYKCNLAVASFYGIHYDFTNATGPNFISEYDSQDMKDVTFNCLTVSLDVNNPKTASFLTGLQTLELHGLIVPYNLVIILANSPSLETLAFSENKILKSDSEGFMSDFTVEKLNMSNLKTLKIKSKESVFTEMHGQNLPDPTENKYTMIIFRFLKEIFSNRKLVNIEIHHPEVSQLSRHIFDPEHKIFEGFERTGLFYDLIHSNRKTLEVLTVSGFPTYSSRPRSFMLYQPQSDSVENVNWLPQITELSAYYNEFRDDLDEFLLSKALPYQIHLKTLAVGINFHKRGNEFIKIEPVSTTLQNLRVHCFYFGNQNEARPADIIKGEYFRNCIQLVELSIVRGQFYRTKFPEFVDLDLLPPTLRNLQLAAVLVFPNENFQAVSFENLKCLQKLELLAKPWFKLGDTRIHQMKMEYVDHLIESMPLLRRLSLSKNEYKIKTMVDNEWIYENTNKTIPEELITELGKRMDLRIQNSTEAVNLTIF